MATLKKKANYFDSVEGEEIKQTLLLMTKNRIYNTKPSYSANIARYPNNLIPFVDKHMNYLNVHPNLDPDHYLANLRMVSLLKSDK